ncbi:MAG: acyl-CoA dehydrogenase, partial [bacterium]|nr:acyl-CoA dehydrogenase [bacterium]
MSIPKPTGAAFLIDAAGTGDAFTPEDFTEEHQAIAETTTEFFTKEVAPLVPEMQSNPTAAVPLLKKAGDLGLLAVVVPERYGGMEMDLPSAMIVAECLGRDGSYSVWHSAHSGLGTMPTLLFGAEDQKQRYLPKLASGELIASYCLSEPQSGSDALNVKTKATLAPGGSHYILNGQKMWVSNGGGAGLFTVFAKVDGDKFTAFLIEQTSEGLSVGAEEKKMGLKGNSTCALYLDNVRVPVENLLGEVGRGHVIAFNVLNLGRLQLGSGCVGGSKNVLRLSLDYANQRRAFGKTIGEFGLIQGKLGQMAIQIFAAETLTCRVAGLVEAHLSDADWSQDDAAELYGKAFEEFALECAMVKVYATETLDHVVDEAVQIHGGYGFHQDYE